MLIVVLDSFVFLSHDMYWFILIGVICSMREPFPMNCINLFVASR